jgi:hypothetical protein
MPTRRLLFPAVVTCAVALPIALVTLVMMDRSDPWTDPVQLGWAWLAGLGVGGFFGLFAYGWAAERDTEDSGQDDESPEDLGVDD